MSILNELKSHSRLCGIPVETGRFSGVPPDTYLVITPLIDLFEVHADNTPGYEVQEARLSLFVKGNYTAIKNHCPHSFGCGFYYNGSSVHWT
jgi:hypothetical protein